jgi:hypothetical protein
MHGWLSIGIVTNLKKTKLNYQSLKALKITEQKRVPIRNLENSFTKTKQSSN